MAAEPEPFGRYVLRYLVHLAALAAGGALVAYATYLALGYLVREL